MTTSLKPSTDGSNRLVSTSDNVESKSCGELVNVLPYLARSDCDGVLGRLRGAFLGDEFGLMFELGTMLLIKPRPRHWAKK